MREFQIIIGGHHREQDATSFHSSVDNFVRAMAARGYRAKTVIADWDADDMRQGKPVDEAPEKPDEYNIGAIKVTEIEDFIANIDDELLLLDLRKAEAEGKDRVGVLTAIDARIAALSA